MHTVEGSVPFRSFKWDSLSTGSLSPLLMCELLIYIDPGELKQQNLLLQPCRGHMCGGAIMFSITSGQLPFIIQYLQRPMLGRGLGGPLQEAAM